MIVTFDKYLFGTEENTPVSEIINGGSCMTKATPPTDGKFTWTAPIGDCDMEIATEGYVKQFPRIC